MIHKYIKNYVYTARMGSYDILHHNIPLSQEILDRLEQENLIILNLLSKIAMIIMKF